MQQNRAEYAIFAWNRKLALMNTPMTRMFVGVMLALGKGQSEGRANTAFSFAMAEHHLHIDIRTE